MSKLIGQGGTITKDAVNVGNITRFSYREVEGDVYGQKQSDIDIDVILDSATAPLRQGDIADYVLTPGGDATWTITVNDAEIIDASIPVTRDNAVIQSLRVEGYTTATIA